MRKPIALAVVLAALTFQSAFAGNGTGFKTTPCEPAANAVMPGSSGTIIRIPEDATTIQGAVDLAEEGDTILIGPGVYKESVKVRTPGLRIRGVSRGGVVLDGENTREIGIDITGADRVLVENMTAHNYIRHGFFWFETTGYWGRYLTAYNNGLYGIYAFDSRCGQLDNSYTSGNADSGFYIGECFPCDAVITDIVAQRNALGYSGTNAGGNLTLRNSKWIENAMGIVPNSLDGEERPPQRGAIIRHNVVADNNNISAPGVSLAGTYWGAGIVIAGGENNIVYGNQVLDHALGGVVLAPLPNDHVWISSGNTIWGNTVKHDAAEWPDSVDLAQGAASGPNNCWADNTFDVSQPASIQTIWDCGQPQTPPGGSPFVERSLGEGAAGLNGRAVSPWQTYPAPAASGCEAPDGEDHCFAAPIAFVNQPDDNGNNDYLDDGAADRWLPALGM